MMYRRLSENDTVPRAIVIPSVSWMLQVKYAMKKNFIILSRCPIMLLSMLFSSIIGVLLCWHFVGSKIDDSKYPPVDECGVISKEYYHSLSNEELYEAPITLNSSWTIGAPIVYLSLGPFVSACCVFLFVHEELHTHLFEILTSTSLCDSAYWISWYVPFVILALFNSIMGGVAAKLVPIHVMENTSFGAIVTSFLFLHLALISASMLLAVLLGVAKRGVSFVILLMLVPLWIPPIYFAINGYYYPGVWSSMIQEDSTALSSPAGLFWTYGTTARDVQSFERNGTIFNTTCSIPIMNEEQGLLSKSINEQVAVPDSEFFVGCYATAGMVNVIWEKSSTSLKSNFFRYLLYSIPYLEFSLLWGNFLGMTSQPGHTFEMEHLLMSPEQLAATALQQRNKKNNRHQQSTAFFVPQYSTLEITTPSDWYFVGPANIYESVKLEITSNCPNTDRAGYNFCNFRSSCPYAKNSVPTQGKSGVALSFILLLQSLLFLIIAAYLAIVRIGTRSQLRKWYFPIQPSYWQSGRSRNANNSLSAVTNDRTYIDGVAIQDISKVYGSNQAVKDVTFQMMQGEVTALLGHNGAGKTTLSQILCCEQKASQGDATVFGYSVTNDPDLVRKMVGICKQDDYLWPLLTAREHLELFAGLRGVHAADIPSTVQTWLESVDLDHVQSQYTSSFSGGMKRRLSVSLATIGQSQKFIVLDEPTTGLDPVSRRSVWRHLENVKHDRTILITTHAMEEADLLADTVVIMKKGELAAFGTPLELKAEHGMPLQFSILVERSVVEQAVHRISEQFLVGQKWCTIQHNDVGNITITVKKVQETEGGDGISVSDLSNFVKWLEGEESDVSEYGFSNGSLEEVFLKVTQEAPADSTTSTGSTQDDEHNNEVDPLNGSSNANLSSYKPKLSFTRQVRSHVKLLFLLNWTGRRSMWSWITYGLMVFVSTWYGCEIASVDASYVFLLLPILFLTSIIFNASSICYWDRNEGLWYYMSSQGMLQSSYLGGVGLYSLLLYLSYGLILLSFLYMTPFFRPMELCDSGSDCDKRGFFESPKITIEDLSVIDFDAGDDNVKVYAYLTPSGYGKMLGVICTFMLTGPGSVLSASYLPGHKFGLFVVGVSVFIATMRALIVTLTYMFQPGRCLTSLLPTSCGQTFTLDTVGHDFLDCVGFGVMNNPSVFCIPPKSGLLPQSGLLQSLGFLLVSNIRFVSKPSSYASEILIPRINDGSCSGDTCAFPLANQFYFKYLGFMALGALCLLVLGLILSRCYDMLVHGLAWSSEIFNQLVLTRDMIDHDVNEAPTEDLMEVQEEKRIVAELLEPSRILSNDITHIEDPEFPPILTHSLQKLYPSLGGLPPKVALLSFDIQVPRGQVLGLLGKNGAGKTTVLKILAAAHEATSGLALVSGFDVMSEKYSVFENLGNCAQFDVYWPYLSVREHLEFLGELKGLEKFEYIKAAREIATAVGLVGDDDVVYNREAQRLSGGMRRRLSIACALVCSPTVFLLDEPTTGLDPATRNSIWNLFTTIATPNRSIIITTHMMTEADTLCNRIAIVSKGKLKVIGTPQYLKDTYGSGYLLQLNLVRNDQDHRDSAMQFVREYIHPHPQLQIQQGKTLRINIPPDLDLYNIFAALYNPQIRPASINQFQLSQSSLEDVFVAMG